MIEVPEVCRECGESEGLKWSADVQNAGGCQDGRIRMNEVRSIFVLGCEFCSETMAIVPAEEIANILNESRSGVSK